jgi:hypothetical protein
LEVEKMVSEADIIFHIPFQILTIPMWQMAVYVTIISACALTQRHKLGLITTYLFTLYWGFFAYFGQAILALGQWPHVATLFLLCGSLHVILTLIAFFREEPRGLPQEA